MCHKIIIDLPSKLKFYCEMVMRVLYFYVLENKFSNIFHMLRQFAAKFCSLTDFKMFFRAAVLGFVDRVKN